MKSALEYCIGLVQRLELLPNVALVTRMAKDLEQTGQTPFEPPNVAGYPTGVRLTAASMLLARYRFAYYAIYEVSPGAVTALMTAGLPAVFTRDELTATLAGRLGLVYLDPNTRNVVNEYLGGGPIDSANLQSKTLGVLYLLACSPEFQLS